MIDINDLRDPILALYDLPNVDVGYTLHYDETNNIRRLHLTPEGLNVRHPQCFVLGGIGHRGPAPHLEFEHLREVLQLQKSAGELKLGHLGKGDFPSLLKSPKIEALLEWLVDQPLFLHYQVLDPLYWSIVDVVDSVVGEYGAAPLMAIAPQLKNDLYAILRADVDHAAGLLGRYGYPDVGRAHRVQFVTELEVLAEERRSLLPDFDFQMLRDVLRIAARLDALPYLEEETPNVLIDGFGTFYLNRIVLFRNAVHVLDIEQAIGAYLTEADLHDGPEAVRNYTFVDSKAHPWIQVSDAVAGILGKLFGHANRTSLTDLRAERERMNQRQRRTLLERSVEECPAFAQYVVSLDDQRRRAAILGF